MVQPGAGRTSPVDDQLCCALYTASRAMTGCYRPMLESLGLANPQYLVVQRLAVEATGLSRGQLREPRAALNGLTAALRSAASA